MVIRPIFVLVFLACSAVVHGNTGPDMSLEAISPSSQPLSVGQAGDTPPSIARYLMARGASGAISPDGRYIAMRYSITGEPQLWIIPIEGGQPRQLTFGNGITFFAWAPDSQHIIYGADNNGNERPSFYRINIDGTRENLILPAAEKGFRRFGDFSADGGSIYFSSTERNGLDYDIYVQAPDGSIKMLFEGSYAYYAQELSPDGRYLIVSESVGEDGDNLYLLDTNSGDLTTVSAPIDRANHGDGGFAWAPDGRGFYFATNRDREFAALTYYDIEKQSFNTLAAPGQDVADVELCNGGKTLFWATNNDGFYNLNGLDLTTGKAISIPSLPEGVTNLSCSDSTARVAVSVNGWATPGDIFTWELGAPTADHVFESNLAGVPVNTLVKPESIRIKARDGIELQGLLYLPPGTPDKTGFPIIFDVHGGPTAQSMAGFEPVAQYHLQHGVAVFQPNVRGSTGFGRTYTQLDDRENRLHSIRDLVDMLEAFKRDPRIDASRAAVMGGSYGGYAVNAVLAAYPGNFIAGVSKYGVADWVTALEVASPALKASDRIEYGDIRDPRWRKFYTEQSPIRQADQINVPVLYSHGVMDPRIDIYETEAMVKVLRANGVPAPYIRIPDEGHGWRKLSNQMFYYEKEVEFLDTYLKGGD